MKVSLIAAMDKNRVIGKENDILGGFPRTGNMLKYYKGTSDNIR